RSPSRTSAVITGARPGWNERCKSKAPRTLSAAPCILIANASSEGSLDPGIDRKRHSRQHAAWIGKGEDVVIAQRGVIEAAGIENRARGIIALVEQVLYQPEQLNILRHLIRGVQVDDPVGRNLRIDVGVVAQQVLAADIVEIGAELPRIGERVFG